MAQHILVTGGAGYIGSHTCKELHAQGFTPITIDTLETGHPEAVMWGPLIKGNMGDTSLIKKVFSDYKPLAVMHFAAYSHVGASIFDPLKYYDNNVANTLSLLQVMEQFACRTIIFSSSCATYGIPTQIPIPTTHQQMPISPYGWSKLIIEQALRDLHQAKEWKYGILRYFNAAGADKDGVLGENHQPESHLIPLAFQTILGKHPYLEVFGEDYPTADGTAIRDYIHVTDLATAHVAALQSLLTHPGNICTNLGTGQGYSVQEIISAAEQTSGKSLPVRYAPRRTGDPAILVAALDHSPSFLPNWPQHSQLENIMQTAWNWHNR
ncbi:UDP-glucose 4-epimerase GalE [Magnetococcus sp. PR-3]|uniref:UDP-glucose 4-epimerase GalE n=1 Tax=Magnetococcus sp. PR-3 TaxID=3120355 RepID=UPI002FCE3918